jgi:uncharacterized damage-inducible protein DinB
LTPPPGYQEPYGTLLATLQDGSREWREELGNPDPKHIVWQAVPNGHSIGALLLHIAEVEVYWIEQVCLGREIDPEEAKLYMSDEIDQDNGMWPTPPEKPISYYFDILDRVRARTLESVKDFEPSDTVRERRGGNTVTLGWILAHVVEHDSYHGGQAVLMHEIARRMAK